MVPVFGNCTGLNEVKTGHFLMGSSPAPVGKYQIMAPDIIPPKCFALKCAQHPGCRQGGGGSTHGGLCRPTRQGDLRHPPAAGFAAGAGRVRTVGYPRNLEHSVLVLAL